MRGRAAAPIAIFALALALFCADRSAARDGELAARLDAALRDRALRGARIVALVVAADDGRVLYQRDPDRALVPASNMKILTAVAALSAFGPTHRFVTEVFSDAPPDADGAVDVLAIRGNGDPALTSELLWRLAADLRSLGIRRVRNGIKLDASAFDGQRWHPSWGPISARAYHAPVDALSANYGAFSATVEAGRAAGNPVRVSVEPAIPYLRVSNRATTGAPRAPVSLVVDRRRGETTLDVMISGVVRASSEAEVYYRSVLDPVRYAGSIIRMQLEANGIAVAGVVRPGPITDSMTLLHEFRGKPLGEIVSLFLKYSNNAIGETLVKALGAKRSGGVGSWREGVIAVGAELAGLGVETEGLAIVDGSGLSYENRVSPRALVATLRIAEKSFRFGPEFVSALPIAAADGTLRERVVGIPDRLRAKTGLLTRVTSLSGYAETPDGVRRVFSILVNGFRGGAEAAIDAVDRFAAELARDDAAIGSASSK